jgi:hypothetical protein
MAKKTTKMVYDVHPGVAMVQKWIEDLPEKTGKTFQQWLDYIRKRGPRDEKERREWLKKEHNLGTNTAWWLAERAAGNQMGLADDTPEGYLKGAVISVEEMFAGAKAALRPIFEELYKLGRALGKDVKICPCKTIVPFYREHVFAEVKPSTRTRIDFGFALKDSPFTKRLLDTGGLAKKARITHRVALTSVNEIDDEVKEWLRRAYDMDAPK